MTGAKSTPSYLLGLHISGPLLLRLSIGTTLEVKGQRDSRRENESRY